MINSIDNVLTDELAKDLLKFHLSSGWIWGFHSANSGMVERIPHFSIIHGGVISSKAAYYNCENELPKLILDTWDSVKHYFEPDDILVRCYANLITVGIDQRMHTDDPSETSKTMILYLNETWNVDWAGDTVFWDRERREIIKSILPKFNTAAIFPGNIWHGVRPVSIFCKEPRITLMFKTKKDVS